MVSRYPAERLAAAAASSSTMTEALEKLGVAPQSGTRKYLRARMRKLGIDVSHFESENVRWTREDLEKAVAQATNLYQVLHVLGVEQVGGQHAHIGRRIRRLGIDTSHFVRPVPRRGRRSPRDVLVRQDPGNARRVPSDRLRRAMLAAGVSQVCACCGLGTRWQSRPLTLEVDHVDGDWRNNSIENLRLLCPNCHATTDNYRGRGKKRHARTPPAGPRTGDERPPSRRGVLEEKRGAVAARSARPQPSAEALRRAVTGSVSIAGALRQLGLPDNSSARRLFRSWVQAEGVDTSHFLGQAHLRGQLRPTVTRPETVLIRHTGVRRTRTRVLRQALRDLGRPERCAECGTAPAWRGAPMTLEIDHIDGDWSNDQAQNLRFLCRNCHSTTATWCRGRGRATSR